MESQNNTICENLESSGIFEISMDKNNGKLLVVVASAAICIGVVVTKIIGFTKFERFCNNAKDPKMLRMLQEQPFEIAESEKRLQELEDEIRNSNAIVEKFSRNSEDLATNDIPKELEKEHQKKMKEIDETRHLELQLLLQQAAIQAEKDESIEKEHKEKLEHEEKRREKLSNVFRSELEKLLEEQKEKSLEYEKFCKEQRQKKETLLTEVQKSIKEEKETLELLLQEGSSETLNSKTLINIDETEIENMRASNKAQIEMHQNLLSQKNIQYENVQQEIHMFETARPQKICIPLNTSEEKFEESKELIISSSEKCIGVIGLPKSGRNNLIGALAGGIRAKNVKSNPLNINGKNVYKFSHPNNGFINGSIKENRLIYVDFFEKLQLSKLCSLFICSYGAFREEDLLLVSLSEELKIPTVIVRTKLDEELDNCPEGESKEDYIKKDKEMVLRTLNEYHVDFEKQDIYNVSALSSILITERGEQCEMKKYLHDDQSLMKLFNSY